MKIAFKLFFGFWKSYLESVFWMIVYLPRIMLWFLMLLGPAMPLYFIGYKLVAHGSEGALIATNIIAIGLVYYFSKHTRWGEWANKVSPFDNFNNYED